MFILPQFENNEKATGYSLFVLALTRSSEQSKWALRESEGLITLKRGFACPRRESASVSAG